MSKSYRAALMSATVVVCQITTGEFAAAQQAPPSPAAQAPAPTTLPPVVVEQKKSPQPAAPPKPSPQTAAAPEPVPAPAPRKKAAKSPAVQKAPAPLASSVGEPSTDAPAATATGLPASPNINSSNAAEAAAGKLEVKTTTGSALALTPRETPATVSIVSEKEIADKGARSFVEALRSVPGVVVGNNPGEVGTGVMRGFYKAHGYSIDGSRVADPVFLGRDYSSFHFDRIEVLKGPSTVVSGTSGLSGTVNIVTKQASTDRTFVEGMVGYGSFDTLQTGVGANIAISPNAALRSTLTFANSAGYVDDTDSWKFGVTNNILLRPSDRFKVTASVDYFKDDFSTAYYATPLVNRSVARDASDVVTSSNGLVLDRANRYVNYNFNDGNMNSESVWLRGAAEYRLTDQWTLRNEASYYHADRLWRDADTYNYSSAPTPSITRGITLISHDHEFWSDRMLLSFDGRIGGLRNRFAVGAEYMETTFGSTRRFGSTPGVDIYDPVRGTYPVGALEPKGSREGANHVTKAVFAENAVNLTPAWILAAGIRYETLEIDRSSFSETTLATTAFGNELESTTWRVGSSYEVVPGTTVFAQYATAVTPVSSALMVANAANTGFGLTTGNSMEAGVKSTFLSGKVTATASVYQIEQDDIVTRDPANPRVPIQGGSQRSRGIEAEAAISLTDRWNLNLSGTLIDTEFTSLLDSAGKSFAGNRPVNAVPYAWFAMTTYRLPWLPATVGAQLTGTGPFFTSNANLYEAKERTVLDAWIAFDVGKGTLRLRGRNLTDEFYAEWADYNATTLYVGAPRSFDATYTVKW